MLEILKEYFFIHRNKDRKKLYQNLIPVTSARKIRGKNPTQRNKEIIKSRNQ